MKTHRAPEMSSPHRNGNGQDPHVPMEAVRAARLALSRGMTASHAFHAIAANCTAQIMGNAPGVAQSDDPESVHQMRVGLRRLRCANRLFRDVAVPSASLKKQIDWLSTQLSDVRDWEVLSSDTLALVEQGAGKDPDLAALRSAVAAMARSKRKKASAVMRSGRFVRAMASLDAWSRKLEKWAPASPVIAANASASESIDELSARTLAREQKRLFKHGRSLRAGDPALRHRLRIAAKRARYAAEFFESLYPPKRMKAFLAPLLALQECLGRLNDFAVADRLLRELQDTEPVIAAGACYARGFLAAETARLDRKLSKRWKRVERSPLPSPRG